LRCNNSCANVSKFFCIQTIPKAVTPEGDENRPVKRSGAGTTTVYVSNQNPAFVALQAQVATMAQQLALLTADMEVFKLIMYVFLYTVMHKGAPET
jgi:hypothetical protein